MATDNGTPLHISCTRGNYDVVKTLLEYNYPIDSQNHKSLFTPLHMAVISSKVEICHLLLNRGCDPNLLNITLEAPLHLAALRGLPDVVKKLIDCGANIDAVDNNGDTPLHICVQNGHSEICSILIHHFADCKINNGSGMTALHKAVEYEQKDCLRILLETKQFDLEVKDRHGGYTPLHLAAIKGNLTIGKMLIEAGADINAFSLTGEFPIILAAKHKKVDFIELLTKNGADENILLSEGSDEEFMSFVVDVRNRRDLNMDFEDSTTNWQSKEAFIQHLAKIPDVDYLRTFFISYPIAFKSNELMDMLISAFNPEPPANQTEDYISIWNYRTKLPIQIRVLSALKHWVREHGSDIDTSQYEKLLHFLVEITSENSDSVLFKVCVQLQQEILDYFDRKAQSLKTYTSKGLNSLQHSRRILDSFGDITQFKPRNIAQTLTLILHEKLKKISSREIFEKICVKNAHTPNINSYISFINSMSIMFVQEILNQDDLEKRCKVIKILSKTIQMCLDYNNIESLFQIIIAFNSSSVDRLTLTWVEIPQKYFEYKNMKLVEDNYALIRRLMEKVSAPAVPFAGILLRDLVYINDGNSNTNDEGLYSYTKMSLLSREILKFLRFQEVDYTLKKDPLVEAYFLDKEEKLNGAKMEDLEDVFWERSKEIQEKKFVLAR
eukprot:TRINITY_DN10364_c0_g1_i1.p1 TRINITY_DN10364_c0_g1~~TRINITY_DN10364_c0_g1_i1.p1  ORF type:complete len:667 (+),score=111.42 TRINITY_DN10364_c0_g1_i1:1711-3711(+)